MRILIAEDDQVLADGLLRSLRSSGYAVDAVASGTDQPTKRNRHPHLHPSRASAACRIIARPTIGWAGVLRLWRFGFWVFGF